MQNVFNSFRAIINPPYHSKDYLTLGILFLIFLVIPLTTILVQKKQTNSSYAAGTSLNVNYADIKYTLPSYTFTGCNNPSQWSYLTAFCYNTIQHSCPDFANNICPITAKNLIAYDMNYMQSHNLGTFTRIVVSIDQLFDQSKWNATTGFGGYDPQSLANLDDMLSAVAANHMKTDLVLFLYEQGEATGLGNQFHPEALDGNHAQMRANYLIALSQLMTHIAANPTDMAAVNIVDLQDEAYYQLDQYFNIGTNVGIWNFTEPAWDLTPGSAYQQCLTLGNNQCTGGSNGHGCMTSSGVPDTTCVHVNISYPWMKDMYTTAKAAAPQMLFTVSDAGGSLLTTNPTNNPFLSQAYLLPFYQYTDVYDEHMYDDNPSSAANLA